MSTGVKAQTDKEQKQLSNKNFLEYLVLYELSKGKKKQTRKID